MQHVVGGNSEDAPTKRTFIITSLFIEATGKALKNFLAMAPHMGLRSTLYITIWSATGLSRGGSLRGTTLSETPTY